MARVAVVGLGNRGGAVPLGKHDEVAADHLATGDSCALAIANDQRARAGEVAQRLQDSLGSGLLHRRDRD